MMSIEQGTPEEPQSQDTPQPGKLLHQAVSRGDLAVVQRLLAAGVDVNARSVNFSVSPLMLATSVEMVDLLLAAGADVHQVDDGYGDALSRALDRGDEAIIVRLLQAGADLNWRDKHGWDRNSVAADVRATFNPETLAFIWSAAKPIPECPAVDGITRDFFDRPRQGGAVAPGPFVSVPREPKRVELGARFGRGSHK